MFFNMLKGSMVSIVNLSACIVRRTVSASPSPAANRLSLWPSLCALNASFDLDRLLRPQASGLVQSEDSHIRAIHISPCSRDRDLPEPGPCPLRDSHWHEYRSTFGSTRSTFSTTVTKPMCVLLHALAVS